MREIEIEGTTFVTDGNGGVMEWGTNLHYDGKGYQPVDGGRVALTSYAAFGDDVNVAREIAGRWCAKAQRALEALS